MSSPFSKFVDRSHVAAPAVAVPATVAAAPAAETAPVEAAVATEPAAKVVIVEVTKADAPVAEQPVDVSAFPAMKDIAIIVRHNNGQVAKMVAGTLGEIKDGAFVVDSIYAGLTDLMAIAQGAAEDGGAVLGVLKVQEEDVDALRANIVRGQAVAWSQMYDSASQQLGMSKMLNAVKEKDQKSVDAFLAAQGLTSWDVPISYSAVVEQPYSTDIGNPAYRPNEQSLIAEAVVQAPTIALMPKDATPSLESNEAYGPAAELPKETREHVGAFNLVIEGAAKVLAKDGDQAVRVLANLMDIRDQNEALFQNVLTCTPGTIQNAEAVAYERDDDDDYGDDRYRG